MDWGQGTAFPSQFNKKQFYDSRESVIGFLISLSAEAFLFSKRRGTEEF